ncbi:MAG: TetR/AcrR family transcriptional regulator [Streptosporangiaceae bacterium]
MSLRLTRAEQAERNRALLLAAARSVFLKRGYHGASVEQIADEAGFSTGVVYSQFGGKADLFLALLEARITERAAGNTRAVEGLTGDEGIARLLEHAASVDRAEPEWGLLVVEFRVHAVRDPELARRYADAHQRTLAGAERAVAGLYQRAGEPPPLPPADLARLLVAIDTGARLEEAAAPGSSPMTLLARLLAHLISQRPAAAMTAPGGREPDDSDHQ